MGFRVDLSQAESRLLELLALPGRSRQEAAVIQYLRDQLLSAGVPSSALTIDSVTQQSPGETGNLIVRLPGQRRGPRRLLMAHVDTVPICAGAEPYIDGDLVRSRNPQTGLGGDDRAGCAVVLTTVLELLRQQVRHPPLTLLFCVQEEIGLHGARYCSAKELGRPTMGFNWDGGDPRGVCLGATGDYALRIGIGGVASHAGVHPEHGVSAAAIAGIAIANLVADGWHGLIRKGRQQGTSNVGVFTGGEATNVVLPWLELRAEARSHNPVFRQKIVAAYRKAFTAAAKSVRNTQGHCGRVEFSAELQYESFRLSADEPAVQLAMSAVRAVGLDPELEIANGGLDANWLTAHGVPTVTLGCGQQDIHTVNETVHLPSFRHACETAMLIASGELG
jgi:tripeptide aminopeptidase